MVAYIFSDLGYATIQLLPIPPYMAIIIIMMHTNYRLGIEETQIYELISCANYLLAILQNYQQSNDINLIIADSSSFFIRPILP